MPDARFRLRAGERSPICPDCAGPKADQARRCQGCWSENVLRAKPAYWLSRTCPDCGGAKSRQSHRCRPCANERLRGVPRSSPVVVPASHIWRRKRFGAALDARRAA
jgi:DnaJ-class molecular chaperone